MYDDVQDLAGHAEPRTIGLYDRGQKKVTRNIVEIAPTFHALRPCS